MRTKLGLGLVLVIGLLLAATGVLAQQGAPVPAIVSFTADVPTITLPEVEAGAEVTLAWHIVNVQAGQRVALDYAVQNGWVSVLTEGEALSPVGSRPVTLRDPLNFGPPTFRLTLLNGRNIVDQRYVQIPYTAADAETTVSAFSADVTTIDRAALSQRSPRITISWQVDNRTPGTNLVFEQVVSDTQIASVELPRQFLYVPSAGSGPVQLVPTDGEAVQLRVRVVNVITGDVTASRDLVIPFTGEATPANLPAPSGAIPTSITLPTTGTTGTQPTTGTTAATPAPGSTAAPTAAPSTGTGATGGTTGSAAAPTINAFTINPTTAAPGSNVTIAWNVTGATTVQIQEVIAGVAAPGVTYVQLPLLGAVSVPVPPAATTSVTYRLTATDDAGQIAQSEVIVTVGSASG